MSTITPTFYQSRWNLFIIQCVKIGLLWLGGVALLTGFRFFYLNYFSENIQNVLPWKQWLNVLKTGFAFDASATAICLLVPFLANCILQSIRLSKPVDLITKYTAYLFYISIILLCISSIIYIAEYGTQFNYFVFEGLYDDQSAILKTVIEQYQPWGSLSSLIILISLFIAYSRYVCHLSFDNFNNRITTNIMLRIVLTSLIVILFLCAARGSFDSRPIKRKWSAVTQDNFVNQLIMNPFRSMAYAYKDYKSLYASGTAEQSTYGNVPLEFNNMLKSKLTVDGLSYRPSHIFLVVMESYDSWPLQPKYQSLNLTPELSAIAKNGLYFPAALPAASSTFNSLSSILSGVPYSGINVGRKQYTARLDHLNLIKQMEKLGYSSQFYYGGLLSWQNIGNYMSSIGTDGLVSAINASGKGSAGVWGIDDEQLFDLVDSKLENNSFNIILSTSYHGPFNLDLTEMGYHFQSKADYPHGILNLSNNLLDTHVLGHLWYSDKALGKFVRRMEAQYPDALFVITGDHYSRRYLHARPSLFELTHVPIVFYGKGIKAENRGYHTLASHMDIMPTLVDLLDDEQTDIKSFGQSLLHHDSSREYVVGFKTVRTRNTVFKQQNNNLFLGEELPKNFPFTHNIKKIKPAKFYNEVQYKAYMATAWQLVMR